MAIEYTPTGALQQIQIPTGSVDITGGLAGSIRNQLSQQEQNRNQQLLADRINAYTESNNRLSQALDSAGTTTNTSTVTAPTNVEDVYAATGRPSNYSFTSPQASPTDAKGRALGWASRISETGSDYGIHGSKGYTPNDNGGGSLGLYQLHSGKGSMTRFLDTDVKQANPELYAQLKALFPQNSTNGYSKEFLNLWDANENVLRPLQHQYAKREYFDNRLNTVSPQIKNLIMSDPRLQEAFFSFNVNGSQRSFNSLTGNETPEEALKKVYDYRTQGLNAGDTRSKNFYKAFDADMSQKLYKNIMREYSMLLGAKY